MLRPAAMHQAPRPGVHAHTRKLAPPSSRAVDAAYSATTPCGSTTSFPRRLALRLATGRCTEGGLNQVRATVVVHRLSLACLAVHAGRLLDNGGSGDRLVQEGLLADTLERPRQKLSAAGDAASGRACQPVQTPAGLPLTARSDSACPVSKHACRHASRRYYLTFTRRLDTARANTDQSAR